MRDDIQIDHNDDTDSIPFLKRQSVEELMKTDITSDTLDLADEELPAAIESILFSFGETVTLDRIAGILGINKIRALTIMNGLINDFKNNKKRGIYIRQIEDSYILSTKPEMHDIIERMFLPRNRPPMSQAAYETLAIIAYNQPVTRSQVEAVRGVSSDSIIARLVEKDLIRECGTLDAPGRPSLFETSELFLKDFGLSSARELPPMDMIMYKTLRDIESSVAQAAGVNRDSQMTIEQLVSSVVPKSVIAQPELPEPVATIETMDFSGSLTSSDLSEMNDTDVMNISEAFFGDLN